MFVEACLHLADQFVAIVAILGGLVVEASQVPNTCLGHQLIPAFHLAHSPLQRVHGLLRIGHNRGQQVWNALIDRQFEHFRVDHDKAALLWRMAVEQ